MAVALALAGMKGEATAAFGAACGVDRPERIDDSCLSDDVPFPDGAGESVPPRMGGLIGPWGVEDIEEPRLFPSPDLLRTLGKLICMEE